MNTRRPSFMRAIAPPLMAAMRIVFEEFDELNKEGKQIDPLLIDTLERLTFLMNELSRKGKRYLNSKQREDFEDCAFAGCDYMDVYEYIKKQQKNK